MAKPVQDFFFFLNVKWHCSWMIVWLSLCLCRYDWWLYFVVPPPRTASSSFALWLSSGLLLCEYSKCCMCFHPEINKSWKHQKIRSPKSCNYFPLHVCCLTSFQPLHKYKILAPSCHSNILLPASGDDCFLWYSTFSDYHKVLLEAIKDGV